MKHRIRIDLFDPAQRNALRRNVQPTQLHRELPEDARSVRELMAKICRQLGATEPSSKRRGWEQQPASDEDLKRLRGELLDAFKDRKGRITIAMICAQISQWADHRNALHTAAFFVEAAAAFNPNDAELANRAGKLALRRAEYEGAKEWYRKGIEIGRRTSNWEAVAVGWSGLGRIERNVGGNLDDAEAYHMRSLAIARQHGLSVREGEGFHALAVLAFDRNRDHKGVTYARSALDTYGKDRSQIVILANDLAWHWMEKDHAYSRVLPIFRECALRAETPANRLVMLGNQARAAAGAEDWQNFESAEYLLTSTLSQAQDREGHAAALLELAKGALMLGMTDKARHYAQQARNAAVGRSEKGLQEEADEFLKDVDAPGAASRQAVPRVTTKPVTQRMDDLATELVLALR